MAPCFVGDEVDAGEEVVRPARSGVERAAGYLLLLEGWARAADVALENTGSKRWSDASRGPVRVLRRRTAWLTWPSM